jgi:hypothetical protein
MLSREIVKLIGKTVTAVGSCGMGKGVTVTGVLQKHDMMGQYVVEVTKENGYKQIYAVYNDTIKETK